MNQFDDGVDVKVATDTACTGNQTDFRQTAQEAFDHLATRRIFDFAWTVDADRVLGVVTSQKSKGDHRHRARSFVLNSASHFPLCEAAHHGNRYAQYVLARYYRARLVLPDDPLAAFEALDAAAENGDDGAKHAMEQIELAGATKEINRTPVAWSDLSAAYWLERAANQGLASAQSELAWMYFQGHGVPIDYVAAYMWSNLAGLTSPDRAADAVSTGRSVCFELKFSKYASSEQVAEAQRLTRQFVPKSEEAESE